MGLWLRNSYVRQKAPDLKVALLLGKEIPDEQIKSALQQVLNGEILPNPWTRASVRPFQPPAVQTPTLQPVTYPKAASGSARPAVADHVVARQQDPQLHLEQPRRRLQLPIDRLSAPGGVAARAVATHH